MKNLALLILLAPALVFAGGDLVNNGGGISEKNIMFAYQRLGNYINLCLSSDFCKIDAAQRDILQRIRAGLPQEQQVPNQIQFLSERRAPGTFIIDREMKVAKTGSRIGSPILINLDLIYTKNEMGYYIPLSVSESVAVLVHELGHHYGNYSHGDLDLLGVRVAMMLGYKTYNSPLLPWSQQISATVINSDMAESFPDILLYVEDQVVDLSQAYQKAIFCPEVSILIPILPLPDLNLKKSHARGSLMHNVHWDRVDNKVNNQVKMTLIGDISHKCKNTQNVDWRSQDFTAEISFTVNKDANDKWVLDTGSIDVEQKRNTWWKIIKFGKN